MELAGLERSTEAFLAHMRREHARRHPGKPCRVPDLATLAAVDRVILMGAVASAIKQAKKEKSGG